MTFSSRAGLATGSVVVGGNEEAFPIASIDNSGVSHPVERENIYCHVIR